MTVQIKISHGTNKCKNYTAQKFFMICITRLISSHTYYAVQRELLVLFLTV